MVTPVIEYCQHVPEIDAGRHALLSYSFGGYPFPRTAAFEPRLWAVVCIDGVFDAGQRKVFDPAVRGAMLHSAQIRWGIDQGLWAFQTGSPYNFLTRTLAYTLEGTTNQILCPVLVCEAADDHFFQGQPEQSTHHWETERPSGPSPARSLLRPTATWGPRC